jgi:hypothetical protein
MLYTSDSNNLHKELLPAEYSTKTRGERRTGVAVPAGEDKYSIVKHGGHTQFASRKNRFEIFFNQLCRHFSISP